MGDSHRLMKLLEREYDYCGIVYKKSKRGEVSTILGYLKMSIQLLDLFGELDADISDYEQECFNKIWLELRRLNLECGEYDGDRYLDSVTRVHSLLVDVTNTD